MNKTSRSPLKKIYPILSVLCITILGAALWEFFLRDFAYYLGNLFVKILSFIFSGYINHLYRDVGKADDLMVYVPALIAIVIIAFFPYICYLFLKETYSKIAPEAEGILDDDIESIKRQLQHIYKNKNRDIVLILLPAIISSFFLTEMFITEFSKISAVNQIERRLEIIRPHIDERNYYLLWSEYRLIDGKEKLEMLFLKTNEMAAKNKITLPEVELFGINISNNPLNTDSSKKGTPID